MISIYNSNNMLFDVQNRSDEVSQRQNRVYD